MHLHLVRHGQTEWNTEQRYQGQLDSNLTEMGIRQAEGLAGQIQDFQFDGAYSSSSGRAVNTAKILLNNHSVDAEPVDSVREINLGIWQAKTRGEIEYNYPEQFDHFWHQPSKFQIDGAETFKQVQQRAMNFIELQVLKQNYERVLVVSHGICIKLMLCAMMNRSVDDIWDLPRMGNCSHSIIQWTGSEYVIEQFAHGLTSSDTV